MAPFHQNYYTRGCNSTQQKFKPLDYVYLGYQCYVYSCCCFGCCTITFLPIQPIVIVSEIGAVVKVIDSYRVQLLAKGAVFSWLITVLYHWLITVLHVF